MPASLLMILGLSAALAAPAPLFSKGAETFRIQDAKGKSPEFRVLDDSVSERALAVAIVTALNTSGEVQPKLPVNEYIDLKIESLKLIPLANKPGEIEMLVRLNGHEVAVDKTVNRAAFLAGKPIEMNFPKTDRDLPMFTVESSGRLRFRLERDTQNLVIETASAKMTYESVLIGAEGSEALQFSGRGIRQ